MSYTNNNSWWNTYYQPQQTPAVQPDWYSNQLKAYQERQAQQAQQAQQAEAAKQTKHADLIKMWQEKFKQPATQPTTDYSNWYSDQLKAYQERQAQKAQEAQKAEAAKQAARDDRMKMWQEKIQQPVTQYGYDSNWNAFPLPSSNLYSGYHQWWG